MSKTVEPSTKAFYPEKHLLDIRILVPDNRIHLLIFRMKTVMDGVHRIRRRIRFGIPEKAEEISDDCDPLK